MPSRKFHAVKWNDMREILRMARPEGNTQPCLFPTLTKTPEPFMHILQLSESRFSNVEVNEKSLVHWVPGLVSSFYKARLPNKKDR